jgi:hypothetical protein
MEAWKGLMYLAIANGSSIRFMSIAIPSPILISKKVGQGTIPPPMAATGANDKREVMYQFICQKIKVSMSRPTYVN